VEIWHNPRCTKSRQTLGLLEDAGVELEVRRYLDDPPSADELRAALEGLGLEPWDVVRTKESVASDLGLAEWPRTAEHRERWIDAMVVNPILIERPIVFGDDGRAVLGRPPENVEALL
jgi:arsenate reductase